MKKILLCAAVPAVCLISACKSPTDVPTPNDPNAHFWTPSIKGSYPKWQPPKEMPKGNPEYEANFAAAEAPKPDAEAEKKTPEIKEPEQKTVKPTVEKPAHPGLTRIDVVFTDKNDVYQINGESVPTQQIPAFLKDLASADPESSILIYYEPKAGQAKLDKLQEMLKTANLTKIKLVTYDEVFRHSGKSVSNRKTAAAPKKVRYVVDTEKASETYTVNKNDTLSKIAKEKYKNGSLWYIIYEANKKTIKNANRLIPGAKLSIPAIKLADGSAAPAPKSDEKAVPAAKTEEKAVPAAEAAPAAKVEEEVIPKAEGTPAAKTAEPAA